MHHPSSGRLFAAIASAALTLLTGPLASAQIATVPSSNTLRTTVQVSGDINAALSPQTVYTVPAGRKFHLTDLILVNYQNVICDFYFPGKTLEIRIQPNAMANLSMLSGPEYSAGEDVTAGTDERLPGDGACTPVYTLMGYLYTGPN